MTAPENNSHILWHDESCYFFSYVAYHRHQSGRKTVATCSHSRVCSVFLVRPSQEKKHNPDRKHTGLHKTAWGRVVQSCAILYTSPATLLLKYDVSFFDNLSLTQFVIAFCYKMNILSPILGVWQSPRNEVDTSESRINLSDTLREN